MIKNIDTEISKKKTKKLYENIFYFLIVFYFLSISVLELYLQGIFTMLTSLVIFAFDTFMSKQ